MTDYIAPKPCKDFKDSRIRDVCSNCGWTIYDHDEELYRWEGEGGLTTT